MQEKRDGEGMPATLFSEGRNPCASLELLVKAKIVRAAKHRTDQARCLGSPPKIPHPAMSAVHHFPGGEVH